MALDAWDDGWAIAVEKRSTEELSAKGKVVKIHGAFVGQLKRVEARGGRGGGAGGGAGGETAAASRVLYSLSCKNRGLWMGVSVYLYLGTYELPRRV